MTTMLVQAKTRAQAQKEIYEACEESDEAKDVLELLNAYERLEFPTNNETTNHITANSTLDDASSSVVAGECDDKERFGDMCLFRAALGGKADLVRDLLLRKGFITTVTNPETLTVVCRWGEFGHDLVDLFLEHHPYLLNQGDADGVTALTAACLCCDLTLARRLQARGGLLAVQVDPDSYASQHVFSGVYEMEYAFLKMARFMVEECGFPVDWTDGSQRTLLSRFLQVIGRDMCPGDEEVEVCQSFCKTALWLLAKGASLTPIALGHADAALDNAIHSNCHELVRAVLEALNQHDTSMPPLSSLPRSWESTIRGGHLDLVDLLRQKNVAPPALPKSFLCALQSKSSDMVNLVIEGANPQEIKEAWTYCIGQGFYGITNDKLDQNEDPDLENETRNTAAQAFMGIEAAEHLLREGVLSATATFHRHSTGETSMLWTCIHCNALRSVQILLDLGADPNQCRNTVPCIDYAAAKGFTKMVRLLLKEGAKSDFSSHVATTTTEGEEDAVNATTPLLHVIKQHRDMELFTLLLEHGANVEVNANNSNGNMLLHEAVLLACAPTAEHWYSDDGYIVQALDEQAKIQDSVKRNLFLKVLLEQQQHYAGRNVNCCNVNTVNNDGDTPLHLAVRARGENNYAVTLLLLHGASTTQKNSSGKSPMDSCITNFVLRRRYIQAMKLHEAARQKLFKLLLQQECDRPNSSFFALRNKEADLLDQIRGFAGLPVGNAVAGSLSLEGYVQVLQEVTAARKSRANPIPPPTPPAGYNLRDSGLFDDSEDESSVEKEADGCGAMEKRTLQTQDSKATRVLQQELFGDSDEDSSDDDEENETQVKQPETSKPAPLLNLFGDSSSDEEEQEGVQAQRKRKACS